MRGDGWARDLEGVSEATWKGCVEAGECPGACRAKNDDVRLEVMIAADTACIYHKCGVIP